MSQSPDNGIITPNARAQLNVQAYTPDWVNLPVTAVPQRIADLLGPDGVDLPARWEQETLDACLENINAIAFLRPGAELQLRTKSLDTVFRPVYANEITYIPVNDLFSKFISGTTGDYLIEILTTLPLHFD